MISWRPSSGPDTARRRRDLLRRVHGYFDQTDALLVDTPALSPAAVSDTQIESLEVHSTLSDAPLYLQTSPEFCMKRLLADGYPDIYTVCRVFRDGESGSYHQPEFTLVEWYRLGFDLESVIADTVAVISAALDRPQLVEDVIVIDYHTAFRKVLGLHPQDAPIPDLANVLDAADDLRGSIGDERDDWLDIVLSSKIIPTFSKQTLTVLQHYPSSQAALARICPDEPTVADRFEVFLGSVELANGYVELTDVDEQARRIENDQVSRRHRGRRIRPCDEALLAALKNGLPACAGVAMGLERLQMIHDETDRIADVISFPFENDR